MQPGLSSTTGTDESAKPPILNVNKPITSPTCSRQSIGCCSNHRVYDIYNATQYILVWQCAMPDTCFANVNTSHIVSVLATAIIQIFAQPTASFLYAVLDSHS